MIELPWVIVAFMFGLFCGVAIMTIISTGFLSSLRKERDSLLEQAKNNDNC